MYANARERERQMRNKFIGIAFVFFAGILTGMYLIDPIATLIFNALK